MSRTKTDRLYAEQERLTLLLESGDWLNMHPLRAWWIAWRLGAIQRKFVLASMRYRRAQRDGVLRRSRELKGRITGIRNELPASEAGIPFVLVRRRS